jgi:hypothetical protein
VTNGSEGRVAYVRFSLFGDGFDAEKFKQSLPVICAGHVYEAKVKGENRCRKEWRSERRDIGSLLDYDAAFALLLKDLESYLVDRKLCGSATLIATAVYKYVETCGPLGLMLSKETIKRLAALEALLDYDVY